MKDQRCYLHKTQIGNHEIVGELRIEYQLVEYITSSILVKKNHRKKSSRKFVRKIPKICQKLVTTMVQYFRHFHLANLGS